MVPFASSEPLLFRPDSRPEARKLVDLQVLSSSLSFSSIGQKAEEVVYGKLEIRLFIASS